MLQRKRLEVITQQLKKNQIVNVKDLSKLLNVTEKTVRLDLGVLERAHILERIHGGAVIAKQQPTLLSTTSYRKCNEYEKSIIARRALQLLHENDVILLDDGSTTLALAKLLGDFKITVLTNDVLIINELMYKPNVSLYVIGGSLKRDGDSFVINGEDAIQYIKKYRVNKLFLGISTIDIENGLMIFYYGDRSTKRAFMAAANEIICMADSSKFNHSAFTRVAHVDEIDTIITDSNISEADLQKYRAVGVNIIVATEASAN